MPVLVTAITVGPSEGGATLGGFLVGLVMFYVAIGLIQLAMRLIAWTATNVLQSFRKTKST